MQYPKLTSIKLLPDVMIEALFDDGSIKKYNCLPLLSRDEFSSLRNKAFFQAASVSTGGYAVVWNDEIDLAASEIWLNGIAA
jgi:Protein of unknown function (DUF2442)